MIFVKLTIDVVVGLCPLMSHPAAEVHVLAEELIQTLVKVWFPVSRRIPVPVVFSMMILSKVRFLSPEARLMPVPESEKMTISLKVLLLVPLLWMAVPLVVLMVMLAKRLLSPLEMRMARSVVLLMEVWAKVLLLLELARVMPMPFTVATAIFSYWMVLLLDAERL